MINWYKSPQSEFWLLQKSFPLISKNFSTLNTQLYVDAVICHKYWITNILTNCEIERAADQA